MVSVTAQANYGAILTFQKSPAPSAVRKENKVRLGTRNPAGRQDLNIFSWHGGLHMARDSRIKNSTPSLRHSTKLYGFFFSYLPHPALRMNHSNSMPYRVLSFPQLHFRTITYLPNISSPIKTVSN